MSVSPQPKYSKSAEVVHGLQVRGVREVSVSLQPKYSKSAEVVHGLQVRHAREGGSIFIWSRGFFHEMHRASARNRSIFNAEVVQGLQVRDVREGGVSQTGKPLKRAEVVQGLQVKDVREGGVSQTGKPLKRAEIVQGLQVKGVREGGRQPHRKAPEKYRGCPWCFPLSHSFHIFPLPAIN
ncbi:hypothetical protein SAMN02745138_02639 [[Clostridium] lactatifermentans DSM 14214]|uniref:Uncharacterized protein n=1 Tax=Anaerotignum lactatifermentans DSM 14214 TaxID=1121323 RepID=A0A1M6WR24_9FIRM|nr:hypothetical protein SAMN02745138_02639 [[Clostridium] lactatifermentans DSM 14214] [Anaerotignum lactatifermentans DSM 14214]